ncbi:MAG: hypothetical protein H0T83_03065, partial [Chthoniobacterales bacterium]|nr:hypothetical protein [Chthoniobacterales bacterium]
MNQPNASRTLKGLLVRVAADQSEGGGYWNGPADSQTCQFVYVAIPETFRRRRGLNKPYSGLSRSLASLGATLPPHLVAHDMHLDPEFDHLTYGDRGDGDSRGAQIQRKLRPGDLLVFYSGLSDVHPNPRLIYAIVGLYVIDSIIKAVSVPRSRWHENAHTRRALAA